MMRPLITIERALSDKRLLGGALGDISTWQTWLAVVKAAHGRTLSAAERELFAPVAGSRTPPSKPVKELIVVASRRSGKGRMGAALAVHAACLSDPSAHLAPGETGVCACISPTRKQAEILLNYCKGYLESSPILRREIREITADEIRLCNGNIITTLAADYRSLRGRTLLFGLIDEASFLRDERSATPDIEAARALLPGLATTNGMLAIMSSPYKKTGLIYSRFSNFGKDDPDTLIVAGASTVFNPTLDSALITAAQAADPLAAKSEWFGEFRDDISTFLDPALIEAATDRGVMVRPPIPGTTYTAFVYASGGRHDAFSAAVTHKENDIVIVDAVFERQAPFDPALTTVEVSNFLKSYRITRTTGDRYSAGWVSGAFERNSIKYDVSERDRSQIYLDVLPLFTSGRLRLVDNQRLAAQFAGLERKTSTTRDRVDHPAYGGADDLSNACSGAATLAASAKRPLHISDEVLARARMPSTRNAFSFAKPPLAVPWPRN